MAGFIDNSGRRGSSLPDPQSINKRSTPIKKRVIKNTPNKNKNNIKRLQSTVTANGGKRSQGIYNGKKIENPTTIAKPVKNNSKRLKNNNGNNSRNHVKSGTESNVSRKNTIKNNDAALPKNHKKKTQQKTTNHNTTQQKKTSSFNNPSSLRSTASTQELEKINNFNKEKKKTDSSSNAKHKKEGYWEKRKRLKREKQERKRIEQKKREEQKERLKKNEDSHNNLTINDIDKTVKQDSDNKDFSHENTESKETVIEKDSPVKKKKKNKKKKKIFGKFIGVWSILLIIAACIIGSWGHYEWTQASINKERDAAYQDGVDNSTDTPTINNVLKIPEQELSDLISSSPGASFPNNPVLERYTLDGWTIPGGSETHGRAAVSMCYTGEGITERKKASAYLVSDNANSEHPNWSVDSVIVTGDNCTVGESAK